jgi:tRNA wybutosine-synthesizing protein 5
MKGDKSEIIDVDNPDLTKYPLYINAQRFETELYPGDIVFIPALWLHNVVYIILKKCYLLLIKNYI